MHIARFIGGDPAGCFHFGFADHWPGVHRGMHFVTSAIEKAGVDEDDAVFDGVDTGRKVSACPAFLVHHADFDRVARQAEHILNRIEQVVGKPAFFWPVLFGLHDIDAARTAVAVRAKAHQVVHRAKRSEHRVQNALGRFAAMGE